MAPIVIPTRHQWWVSLEVWVLTTMEIVGFDDGGSMSWVWIGVRAPMGLNRSSDGFNRDSDEALVPRSLYRFTQANPFKPHLTFHSISCSTSLMLSLSHAATKMPQG